MAQYRIGGASANEIVASVENEVRVGRIAAGAVLPSVRALAAEISVSPGTVAQAYRALRRRGVVETDGRRGTRVRDRTVASPRPGRQPDGPPGARDLSHGAPDLALLPALAPVLARLRPSPLNYLDGGPLPELVELGAARLAADGVPADWLAVTHGALDAIERCLMVHTQPGDKVAVEDPGWANVFDLVGALGLHPLAVRVDEQGPLPADLASAAERGARAAIVTSRAQNPTGAALTPARAAELRAVLADHPELLLIEDDHAAELAAVALSPLSGATKWWVFIRSVSKPYGPDLRVALVAGDQLTVATMEARQRLGVRWVSHLNQSVVLELWRDPAVAEQVRAAGAAYDARRTALIDALDQRGLAAYGSTGLNVWVPVLDETTVVSTLRDAGVLVAPGARFRLATPPAIRVSVSTLPAGEVGAVADAIAAAVAARGLWQGV